MSHKDDPTGEDRDSRQLTAKMLRRLRDLTKQVRMLKADIDSASRQNERPHLRTPRRHSFTGLHH